MRNALWTVALLALGLWLGAQLFFAIGVAPPVFSVLSPQSGGRALAGDIAGRALTILHLLGAMCGLVFLSFAWVTNRLVHLAAALVIAMLVLTAISQWVITPRIHALRPRIEQDEGVRQQFGALHAASTGLEGIVFLCGIGAFAVAAKRS